MKTKNYFNTSIETRKSNIQAKSNSQSTKIDVLPYLNLLDKCTQILREDRLWVRNQLKAGNEEIINIFRTIKKPLNLQHLQIKLRKHITAVKSKAKMEQLMKFKENMTMGQTQNIKFEKTQTHNRSQHKEPQSKVTYEKYKIPSTTANSSSVDRVFRKTNNSMEKSSNSYLENTTKPLIYPYKNNQVPKASNYDKPFSNYEVPMEQITERQSQNVTSARHRVFHEEGFNYKNYQQNRLEKAHEEKAHTYNRWQRPQETKSNFLSQIRGFVDRKFQLPAEEEEEVDDESKTDEIEKQFSEPMFQKHNNYMEQAVKNEEQELNTFSEKRQNKSIIENDDKKDDNFLFSDYSPNRIPMEYKFRNEPKEGNSSRNTPHLSTQRKNQESSFLISSQNRSKDEDLFTSPELLLECRKFINKTKSKNNSTEKNFLPSSNYIDSLLEKKTEEFKPLELETEDKEKIQKFQPFSNMLKEINTSIKQSQYSFPVAIEEKSERKFSKPEQNFSNYEYFHTFAASNQKRESSYPIEQASYLPQEIVDSIMSKNPSPVVPVSQLLSIIKENYPSFYSSFLSEFKGSNAHMVDVGRFLEKMINKKYKRENDAQSIYCLLDIDKKGFIRMEDVQLFLEQFEQANVDGFGEIQDLMWSIFEMASESDEGKQIVDYWGLYSIKQSEQFQYLSDILKQYEFEIDEASYDDEEYN